MDFHDPVAGGLHLAFAVWCLFAGAILFRLSRHHPPGYRFSVLVYVISAVLLYTCSGLFHSLRYLPASDPESDPQFEFFRRLDLSAIFLLIAGSCVPVCVYILPKWWRRASLALQLGWALTGVVLVWAMTDVVAERLLFVYIAMGLVALVPIRVYTRILSARAMALLLLFAGIYVVSALIQSARWPDSIPDPPLRIGYHEIFHFGNMVATLLHSILLMKYILPHADRPLVAPTP